MHLVVPNKWMANAGAAFLRRKLLEDCGLLRLSDFGACRVFESARVHTMTVLAEKRVRKSSVWFRNTAVLAAP